MKVLDANIMPRFGSGSNVAGAAKRAVHQATTLRET